MRMDWKKRGEKCVLVYISEPKNTSVELMGNVP